MKARLAILLLLVPLVALAGPDWQPPEDQTRATEYIIEDPVGTPVDDGFPGFPRVYRFYVGGVADTSSASNQVDPSYADACSCWVFPDTMNSGAPLRSTWGSLWRIHPDPDSLLVLSMHLPGWRAQAGSVDDTSMVDRSITAAKIDTGAVGSLELADSVAVQKLTGSLGGSAVVAALPFFFMDVKYPSTWSYAASGAYQTAYYVAGVDTSWAAWPSQLAVYDPGGASEELIFPGGASVAATTRPFFAACKPDSVVVTTTSCCDENDPAYHLLILVAKKNLWR